MAKRQSTKSELYVVAPDIHYPLYSKEAFGAMLAFIKENPVAGFIFLGDQLDNQEVSPYTKGKAKLRIEAGTLLTNDRGFDREILQPIERLLPKNAVKVWIDGNHCHWREQLVEEQPELDGVQTYKSLRVEERGWTYIACGKHFRYGKLTFLHGEQLSGIGNQNPAGPAKKAVDSYATNVLLGHFHAPGMSTKLLPFDNTQKYQAYVSPILGNVNPGYLRNRPTAWLNGFAIVEFLPSGQFNVFLVNVIDGQFAYGGNIYRAKP